MSNVFPLNLMYTLATTETGLKETSKRGYMNCISNQTNKYITFRKHLVFNPPLPLLSLQRSPWDSVDTRILVTMMTFTSPPFNLNDLCLDNPRRVFAAGIPHQSVKLIKPLEREGAKPFLGPSG